MPNPGETDRVGFSGAKPHESVPGGWQYGGAGLAVWRTCRAVRVRDGARLSSHWPPPEYRSDSVLWCCAPLAPAPGPFSRARPRSPFGFAPGRSRFGWPCDHESGVCLYSDRFAEVWLEEKWEFWEFWENTNFLYKRAFLMNTDSGMNFWILFVRKISSDTSVRWNLLTKSSSAFTVKYLIHIQIRRWRYVLSLSPIFPKFSELRFSWSKPAGTS